MAKANRSTFTSISSTAVRLTVLSCCFSYITCFNHLSSISRNIEPCGVFYLLDFFWLFRLSMIFSSLSVMLAFVWPVAASFVASSIHLKVLSHDASHTWEMCPINTSVAWLVLAQPPTSFMQCSPLTKVQTSHLLYVEHCHLLGLCFHLLSCRSFSMWFCQDKNGLDRTLLHCYRPAASSTKEHLP